MLLGNQVGSLAVLGLPIVKVRGSIFIAYEFLQAGRRDDEDVLGLGEIVFAVDDELDVFIESRELAGKFIVARFLQRHFAFAAGPLVIDVDDFGDLQHAQLAAHAGLTGALFQLRHQVGQPFALFFA